MEQQRFDDLSRSLAEGLSRRRIMGALLGGLGALRLGAVEAACRQGGAGCSRDGQCCTGKCFKAAGVCSCTKTGKGRCKQPANRCRQTVCGDNGRCAPGANREQGFQCAPEKGCNASGQCVSHCEDGAKNYDETDIDCGGSCSPCSFGLGCKAVGDCLSGICCDETCLNCKPGEFCNADASTIDEGCCQPRTYCNACQEHGGADGCGGTFVCGSGQGDAFCPPAFGSGTTSSQLCCKNDDCPCGTKSDCCGDLNSADFCFVGRDDQGNDEEFCCISSGRGVAVCGAVCCESACNEDGECPGTAGRVGSYRRGPIG